MNNLNSCNVVRGGMKLSAPRLEKRSNGWTRVVCSVDLGTEQKEVWLEVENAYAEYLCAERSDAFVIGLLPYAMRSGMDIACETPISEQLLFQLRTYLIPSLAKNSNKMYRTNINAKIAATPFANAGGVGAGISCGVDSMHVLKNFLNPEYPSLKLTHLTLNQVGAFGDEQFQWTIKHAEKLCRELGIKFIKINSNIAGFYSIPFAWVHTFVNSFAVYALQKLWNVFYYGSPGLDFQQYFSLKNADCNDAAHYDLLSLDCFSTRNLKIYSEGGALERYEKIEELQDFKPAQNYLQVCVYETGGNCGKCFKCVRTLLILDAMGALDKFTKVFDIAAYRANRRWYLKELYFNNRVCADRMLDKVYAKLGSEISLRMKLEVRLHMLKCYIAKALMLVKSRFVKDVR